MNYLKIVIIFLLFTNTSCAQEYLSKSELESEILGTWYYEKDSKSKIIFYNDGKVKEYFEEELKTTSNYKITDNCDGEKLQEKEFFLQQNNKNGNSSCAYIEAINYNDNGIFSIMTKSQGKIIVFKRNP